MAVTSTSAITIPDWSSRRDLVLIGDDTADVTLALRESNGLNSADPEAVDGEGPVLKAGTTLRLDTYTGPIAMVTATTASVGVIEI